MRVYNRALSGDELYSLWYSTAPKNAPVITTQPLSITVKAGNSASFSVSATGVTQLSYQWLLGGKPIAGANSPSLTINNAQLAANGGHYSVVVSNAFKSTSSAPAELAVLSNLDGSITKNYSASPLVDPAKDSLVYIVHGRTPPPLGEHDLDWMDTMARAIASPVPSNWAVVTHAWTKSSIFDITEVIGCAEVEGKKEGAEMVRLAPEGGWKRVHLIAHSAGAKLVDEMAIKLRAASDKNVWNTELQLTFLDPYTGVTDLQRDKYGKKADWTDNYFDYSADTSDVDVENLHYLSAYGRTDGPLTHAHNVDVTDLDVSASVQSFPLLRNSDALTVSVPYAYTRVSTHGFPIKFYQAAIPPSIPYVGSELYGFGLSKEGGGAGIANVATYPLGNNPPKLLKGANAILRMSVPTVSSIYSNLNVLPNATSNTGSIQLNGAGLNLGVFSNPGPRTKARTSSRRDKLTQRIVTSSSEVTGPPAWISIAVSPQTHINYFSCDVTFNGSEGSSGFITVYWNDKEIGAIDEDFINSQTETYSFEVEGAYFDKNNCLGFRLDPFSAEGSSVSVTNIQTEFAGVSEPTTLFMARQDGAPVLVFTGNRGQSFLIQASTDLSDWSPVANISLIDGNTVRFVDPDAANYPRSLSLCVALAVIGVAAM